MKRRQFVQFAASALASLGLSQRDFFTQANRYGKTIAQNTPRKLALLVGINQYPAYPNANLRGCLTDVDLQYELLVNRFGFHPDNVVKVVEKAASRDNIITTFKEHLIAQARPGDVVVFHYSGHGARVKDPYPIDDDNRLNGTLVPCDGLDDTMRTNGVVPDIMGSTLFLLRQAIDTDNVTTILDSCYSGGGLRGSAVVRSLRQLNDQDRHPMAAELALQEELLANANLSRDEFQRQRQVGWGKGLSISSAKYSELALELPYGGTGDGSFHAGVFTYLLTRYLWQVTGTTSAATARANLQRTTQVTARLERQFQHPTFKSTQDENLQQPMYFTAPVQGPAEAVITQVNGDKVNFWLGGMPVQALGSREQTVRFTAYDQRREVMGEIEQTARMGLRGEGRLIPTEEMSSGLAVLGSVRSGLLLRETLVGLPHNMQLVLGVDESLGEAVPVAIEAFSQTLVSSQTGRSQLNVVPVGRGSVDYILGRMTDEQRRVLRADGLEDLPTVGRLALFSAAMVPIGRTAGLVDEPASAAAVRLRPVLKRLLVNKVLGKIAAVNSTLPVAGEIFAADDGRRAVPLRGGAMMPTAETFRDGDEVKIRVDNQGVVPLYLTCLAIDSQGEMTVVYPASWHDAESAALIEANNEVVIPAEEEKTRLNVSGPGVVEVLTLMSTGPLAKAFRALQEIARGRGIEQGMVTLEGGENLDVLTELLGDVDGLSRSGGSREGQVVVDGTTISVLSTVIEVAQ